MAVLSTTESPDLRGGNAAAEPSPPGALAVAAADPSAVPWACPGAPPPGPRLISEPTRRRDRDNLLASLKAAFDGIADAGLVENDAGLTHLPVHIVIDPRTCPCVSLFIIQAGRTQILESCGAMQPPAAA